ncbi:RNA polymerase sigma factor [Corynebacterium aquilae]|uniref:RNA polymerase sigma factor n=1 Tax=Corynebacterium aquilae DSM 44791 TaxID=1431546 RepID=A0A1L7CDQ2_9CORY|nr:sigma-70 family RNA polymerase sigma factor [Corynebacterium aquilae]APT83913.1 RNA polymerase sigma factor [Corynebacterium aquilae DSM 44791]
MALNNESALLAAARKGDGQAFGELVTNYRLKAFNACLRITGNHHDAEDALQAAVYLAWKNLDKFRGEAGFGTWFYRIASNAAMDLLRRRKEASSLDEDGFGNEVQLEDSTATFESQLAENDRLNQALDNLTDESREALVLFAVVGMKIAEIAKHQDSSVSATKVRIHRAKKALIPLLA